MWRVENARSHCVCFQRVITVWLQFLYFQAPTKWSFRVYNSPSPSFCKQLEGEGEWCHQHRLRPPLQQPCCKVASFELFLGCAPSSGWEWEILEIILSFLIFTTKWKEKKNTPKIFIKVNTQYFINKKITHFWRHIPFKRYPVTANWWESDVGAISDEQWDSVFEAIPQLSTN